ncbi:hypothetical protein PBRA_001915 [Plasmodiophora brassicae]|uniref:Pentacotripeptide-repeat region of PRORP domain-containing protein n=1 Tax=Plasmodiophora brassicae TaxID=37360 RepID=A0A0G4J1U5_PLABS|nr:hypothetical protein PBRA_001915 [Plasmodiophora brassicae]
MRLCVPHRIQRPGRGSSRGRAASNSLASRHVKAFRLLTEYRRWPSVPAAVRFLEATPAPSQGWDVFRHVVDSRLRPRLPFFQIMLLFCQRHMPCKAPDVLRAALRRRVPVRQDDSLFCAFLGACKRARPPMLQDALDLYRECGPKTDEVISAVVSICRASNRPDAALPLVADAVDSNARLCETLVCTFAASCAESRTALAADTAERLVDLMRSGRVDAYRVDALYEDLVRALLAQDRFDSALGCLDVMASRSVPPSATALAMCISAFANAGRVEQAMSLFDAMQQQQQQRRVPLVAPAFVALVAACGGGQALESLDALHRVAAQTSRLENKLIANAFIVAYGRCRRPSVSEGVFRGVRDPDASTFDAMMTAYQANDMLPEAAAVFRSLKRTGLALTREAAVNALCLLARSNCVPDAMHVFDHMVKRSMSVPPTVLASLVGACGRASQFDALERIAHYCTSCGSPPDAGVVSAFVAACQQCNRPEYAQQFVCSVPAPDLSPATLLGQ